MEQVVEALQRANVVATAQGERLNALEEQRNALAEALQRVNTALTDVQEADQCTREIMGLIGQQWATLAPSHSETSRGSSGKIEIFSDPGPYDSSKAKFEEWWMMLRFSSWVVLFFSSLLFVPHLLSWGPFLMLTITTFLSWDPSHSPYKLSKPLRCSKYYCHTGGTLCLSLLSHG